MISYEEAGRVLDEAADALPEEIYRDLNGGVNLIRGVRTDEHGLLIMGTYNVNQMGRYVEIYYGSFRRKYPDAPPEKCARELVRTLKHELTHHIESLAMDRSLEKWDEQHVAELLAGLDDELEPLEIGSVLFVDADGSGLAETALAMFETAARENGMEDIAAACASMGPSGPLSLKAVRAAARYGVEISSAKAPPELTKALCEDHDAVMCMTAAQADALAARWPELDEKIMCLGETDYVPPRLDTQGGWNKLADRLAAEINALAEELMGPEDGDD